MKKLKWGVIGVGGIAFRRTIPEGIMKAENAVLKAVQDINEGSAEKAGEIFGSRVYHREEDLLADNEVEAVYIATPAYLHFSQIRKALEANKHVLVEKPFALKIEEGKKILKLARNKRLKVGVDFMMRFHSHNSKIAEMVKSNTFGRIVMVRAQLSCWYPKIKNAWRQIPKLGGGGSLIDMGCHCIDLLEYILNTKVSSVCCKTAILVQSYQVEDTAVALVEFKNGALGIIDACFNIPDESSLNVLEIYGSKGSVIAKGTIGQSPEGSAAVYLKKTPTGYDAQQTRRAKKMKNELLSVSPYNTYRAQIESFSYSILENKPVFVSGEDGLWNQKVILACYESSKKGKMVRVK